MREPAWIASKKSQSKRHASRLYNEEERAFAIQSSLKPSRNVLKAGQVFRLRLGKTFDQKTSIASPSLKMTDCFENDFRRGLQRRCQK